MIRHASSADGRCAVLPGCACRKYHSSRRDAFKAINQDPLAYIDIDREGASIDYSPEAHDARVEAISPKPFDETVRISQFISDPHLHPDHLPPSPPATTPSPSAGDGEINEDEFLRIMKKTNLF